jgi:hypothetical protein
LLGVTKVPHRTQFPRAAGFRESVSSSEESPGLSGSSRCQRLRKSSLPPAQPRAGPPSSETCILYSVMLFTSAALRCCGWLRLPLGKQLTWRMVGDREHKTPFPPSLARHNWLRSFFFFYLFHAGTGVSRSLKCYLIWES